MWRTITILSCLAWPVAGYAQSPDAEATHDESVTGSLDAEARALFMAGTTAFESARYEDALQHFRRAYELSQRAGLLYNIGITADRLRMDREALEAFELFLAHVPDHPKRRETEVRVAVLRRTIEQSGAPVADAAEASETESPGDGGAPPGTAGGGRTNVVPFVGAAALGIVGLAGLVAAVIGLTSGDDCLTQSATGACIEQRTPNGLAVGVYGGLGLAAIAGAVLWLVVGTAGDDERPSASVRGHALDLGWSF